jgi:redox-sensitive bicupin YhaK (pirin superfamily)
MEQKLVKPLAIFRGNEVRDGAGVKIRRIFGSAETYHLTDPFLLLDFFGSTNPEEYLSGFPWHPHRGIETLTYLLHGKVEHEDSLGNTGTLRAGEIQWMTAGSGIFHQEMPEQDGENPEMKGFQLWINLERNMKFAKPTYRYIDVKKLKMHRDGMTDIKVISSGSTSYGGSAVLDNRQAVTYLDITSDSEVFQLRKEENFTSIIIPLEGKIDVNGIQVAPLETLILDKKDGFLNIKSIQKSRYLYLSGRRINEQIAWYGPVVMNTWDEIRDTFRELENGTFVRDSSPLFI